jgi:hypothetical protein
MERNGFIFYRGFRDALAELPEFDRIALTLAVIDYGLDGTIPELQPLHKAIFMAFKPQLDANNKRYQDGSKGAEHGKKGGRPPKNPTETPKKPLENPTETPKEKENVKDNAKDNDNDNAKDNAKDSFTLLSIKEIRGFEDAAYKWLQGKGGDTKPESVRRTAESFWRKNPNQFKEQSEPVPLYHRKAPKHE